MLKQLIWRMLLIVTPEQHLKIRAVTNNLIPICGSAKNIPNIISLKNLVKLILLYFSNSLKYQLLTIGYKLFLLNLL